jgi:predicted XRE-type DNA-binding protein
MGRMNYKLNETTKGSNNTNAKLTLKEVDQIKVLLKEGIKQSEIADKFKISQPQVSNIKNAKRWFTLKTTKIDRMIDSDYDILVDSEFLLKHYGE